jgi:hypothetical protein
LTNNLKSLEKNKKCRSHNMSFKDCKKVGKPFSMDSDRELREYLCSLMKILKNKVLSDSLKVQLKDLPG